MGYPRFVSHKEVGAAKISEVEKSADGSIIVHLEGGFDNVVVPHSERNHKPHPEKGWYLVQYADGYISFSPAKAFEEGYTAVTDEAPNGAVDPPAQVAEEPVDDDGEGEDDDPPPGPAVVTEPEPATEQEPVAV